MIGTANLVGLAPCGLTVGARKYQFQTVRYYTDPAIHCILILHYGYLLKSTLISENPFNK